MEYTFCESPFIKLNQEIAIGDQVLTPFNPNLPLILACNASLIDVARVPSHVINGIEKPIAFALRFLTSSEQNYSQLDQEALAIMFSISSFSLYVLYLEKKVKLITDNK